MMIFKSFAAANGYMTLLAVTFSCRQIELLRAFGSLLGEPNRILSSSSCISETPCLIVCEIYLFVTAVIREANLLVLT